MSNHAINLGFFDLCIASALVLVAALISYRMRLGLERQLRIAALRTVVQLLLIGFVLKKIFMMENIWAILVLSVIMVVMAGRAAVARPKRTVAGMNWLAMGALSLVGFVTTFSVTAIIIGVDPWYKAQYAIPLLGMILGNSLNGLSLCIDSMLESLSAGWREVEMELSLGASRWEAAQRPLAEAVRRGMMPTINSMMVVGIVSLPGMMTGQILEGANPVSAVKYQIVVMFMIAASTAMGSLLIAFLMYKRLFNARHQLNHQLIHSTKR
ncbi:conserved uncharacterized protein, UPF0014 [Desulfosarcina variabilis str. Montpellier]